MVYDERATFTKGGKCSRMTHFKYKLVSVETIMPVWKDSVSDTHNSVDVYLWEDETEETNMAKVQRASSSRKSSSQDSKQAK